MNLPGRLPVAPRPLPGEALSSWVSRFAARYGLELDRFMAALVPGVNWTEAGGAMRLLDRGPTPPGTDAALAMAANLPLEAVIGLRLHAPAGRPFHPWLRRSLLNLCCGCAGDMVAQRGEIHWRANWAFGGMVFCPEHRLELGLTACRACGWSIHPRAVQCRLRLWCATCSACSDGPSDGQQHLDWASRLKDIPVVHMSEAAWTLVSRLQSDLLRAARGQAPEGAWGSKTRSGNLLAVVRHLAFLLVGFPWSDRASPHWHPGYEHAARMVGALAVVAAVLDGAASFRPPRPAREPVLLVAGG